MTTVVFKLDVLSSNRKIFSRQARFAGSDSKQNHTLLDLCLALCYIPPSQSVGKIEKVGRGLVGSMREKEIPLVTRPPFLSSPLTKDLDQATIVLRWLKTVSSTFQDLSVWWVIITTLYRLMPKSWYQQTAQLSVNKLLLILWHNRLP